MTPSNQATHATLQQQIETVQAKLADQLAPAEVLAELSKSITTLVQTENCPTEREGRRESTRLHLARYRRLASCPL